MTENNQRRILSAEELQDLPIVDGDIDLRPGDLIAFWSFSHSWEIPTGLVVRVAEVLSDGVSWDWVGDPIEEVIKAYGGQDRDDADRRLRVDWGRGNFVFVERPVVEVAHLRQIEQELTRQYEVTQDNFTAMRKDLTARAEKAEAQVTVERKRADSILREARRHKRDVDALVRERSILAAVVFKALELLPPNAQGTILGYWDGLDDGVPEGSTSIGKGSVR